MLGSVAKSVVESAPCSVEIVRLTAGTHTSASNRNMRILLATDGSDASLAASRAVAETNWPEHTEVKVVSVVNPIVYSLEEIGFFRDKGTARARRAIGDAVQMLKGAPLKISGEVIAGATSRRIIERARDWHADLIIVGTHERRGLKRLALGSSSAAVANRAHCSVRVIRGHGASRKTESLSVARRSSSSVQNVAPLYKRLARKLAA
jgi:nucleotide-binding universal stress UspA family protein